MSTSPSLNIKELKKFGFAMFAIIGVVGIAIPLIYKKQISFLFVLMSLLFLVAALISPIILDLPYRLWMRLGVLLGKINSFLILSFIFYFLIVPLGIFFKIFSRKSLMQRVDKSVPSYKHVAKEKDYKYEMLDPF